jgi:CubicO group peptidase (beta-lactamase class C family)
VWDDLYSQGDSPIGLGEFLEGYLVPGGEDYRAGNFYGFAPGKNYRYSNVGASLAAYLVEPRAAWDSTSGATIGSSSPWR